MVTLPSGEEVAPEPDGGQADLVKGVAQSTCRCIDWYSEGESRTVEVGGVRVTVRFIGRKGRRGRIAIEAPAGAVFRALDGSRTD